MLDRLLAKAPAWSRSQRGASRSQPALALAALGLLSTGCLARFEVGGGGSETSATSGADGEDDTDASSDTNSTTETGGSGSEQNCEDCDPVLEVCESDSCVCRSGLTPCGGVCADLETDPQNCGGCGSECEEGPCEEGDCQATGCTEENSTDCDGACVDLEDHPLHCGACMAACMADELCVESECVGYEPGGCESDLDCDVGVCCEVEDLDQVCLDGDQCP